MHRDAAARRAMALFPTPHQLRAALRAGDVALRHAYGPVAPMDAAWHRTPTDAVFSPDDLLAGAELLAQTGLLATSNGLVVPDPSLRSLLAMNTTEACELLAGRLLEAWRPLWLSAAVGERGVSPQLIPDDVLRALAQLIPDPSERESFLLAMGRRFTEDDRRRVGNIAEEAVVAACRDEFAAAGRVDLAKKVIRVSLVSDQLGYDVAAPRQAGTTRHIEVKGTRARGTTIAVFLFRNEAATAMGDRDWSLVVCRVGDNDAADVVGWTTVQTIMDRLPADPSRGGAWQLAEVYLDTAELSGGLPPWRL